MASIVDPPPSVHHTRSEAIAGGKKKSDIEMYHAMQSTTNTKGMHNELHHENSCTFFSSFNTIGIQWFGLFFRNL